MAVIIQIREKLGIVLVLVIALAIVSFLLMDSLSSSSNMLGGTGTTAGVVNGEEISIQDYEKKVQETIENYKINTQNANVNEQTVWQLREETWNRWVFDIVLSDQFDELGIQVTADELFDLVQGPNPHPEIVRAFSNPETGQFDPSQVMLFLQNLDQDQTGDSRTRWVAFEKFLREDRLRTKYASLAKKAIYVPTWQAKDNYKLFEASVDLDFVYLPYAEISDNEITVTDQEIKEYINENKEKYQQEESRAIEYVLFNIAATAADSAKAKAKLADLAEDFRKTESDSVFIKLYSDRPYDYRYLGQDEIRSSIADTIFEIDTNDVVGPYLEGNAYVLAKLIDKKKVPDSLQARHIFLDITNAQTQEDVEFKRSQADTLVQQLNDGADFADLALQFSDDDDTKFDGGDWGWIKPGEKFKSIDNALFYKHKEGDIFHVAADEPGKIGFHVIEITKAKPTKDAVKVGYVVRNITPSIETERATYAKANEFVGKHNTQETFKAAENEYSIRLAEGIERGDNEVSGLGAARDVVKWAYAASKGQVSNVFTFDDKYVVCMLSKTLEEGLASVDDIRTQVEVEVKKKKKADQLQQKLSGSKDLDQLASKVGQEVKSVAGLTFTNSFLTDVGQELKVVNTALAMSEGEVSKPIAGNNGVFVIKVAAKSEAQDASDYSLQKQSLGYSAAVGAENAMLEAVKDASEVKDERYKFY